MPAMTKIENGNRIMKTHLSDKPSEMIRQALADLRLVEKDERYSVEMGEWHSPRGGSGTCAVCMAGAVMSRVIPPDVIAEPYEFEDCNKLRAIDRFRIGDVEGGLQYLRISHPESVPDGMGVERYRDGAEAFHRDMAKVAAVLESVGL
jgi:hypothetical protein